jgi:hypothetical protein
MGIEQLVVLAFYGNRYLFHCRISFCLSVNSTLLLIPKAGRKEIPYWGVEKRMEVDISGCPLHSTHIHLHLLFKEILRIFLSAKHGIWLLDRFHSYTYEYHSIHP